jgi:hypothetical protein
MGPLAAERHAMSSIAESIRDRSPLLSEDALAAIAADDAHEAHCRKWAGTSCRCSSTSRRWTPGSTALRRRTPNSWRRCDACSAARGTNPAAAPPSLRDLRVGIGYLDAARVAVADATNPN